MAAAFALLLCACEEPLLHQTPPRSLLPCGDGIVQSGEECDDGADNSDVEPDACRSNCARAFCGDGIQDAGEECDSGNNDGGTCFPGCSAATWTLAQPPYSDYDDEAFAVAAGAGSIFVAGYHEATNLVGLPGPRTWVGALDPQGNELWIRTEEEEQEPEDEPPAGMALGLAMHENSVIVAGQRKRLIWVHKLDATSGADLWAPNGREYGSEDAAAADVAVDSAGNILVTGHRTVAAWQTTIWTAELDPAGNILWEQTHTPAWAGRHQGVGVAVDADDHVLVAANLGLTAYNWRPATFWLGKYDRDGALIWSREYDGVPGGAVECNDVAVDAAGNVLLVGQETYAENHDAWIRKYDPNGVPLWTRRVDGPDNSPDAVLSVTVSTTDEVVVSGVQFLTDAFERVWLARMDTDGEPVWNRYFAGAAGAAANAVTVDDRGNIVVAGYESVEGEGRNVWARGYLP